MFSNIPQGYQFVKDHSKTSETEFWMIQRAKNEVFGQILRLSVLDRLYTAYYDSTENIKIVIFGLKYAWYSITDSNN